MKLWAGVVTGNNQSGTVRTYVTLSAKVAERFDVIVRHSGQAQVVLLSRVVDWFCSLPPDAQEAVYLKKDAVDELIRLRDAEVQAMTVANTPEALARLTPGQTARLARDLLDRLAEMAGAPAAGSNGSAPTTPLKDAVVTPPPQQATGAGVTRGGVGQTGEKEK